MLKLLLLGGAMHQVPISKKRNNKGYSPYFVTTYQIIRADS